MKKYEFRSTKHDCDFQLEYGSTGTLVGFRIMKDEGVSLDELARILESTISEEYFLWQAKKLKIPVIEILPDLSFETAYKKYGNTYGAKKVAQKLWEKMTDQQRTKVFKHMQVYEYQLKHQPGVAKKYFETYLRSGQWDNE